MQVKLVEVTVENVQKGRNNYSIATVAYRANGQSDLRSHKVVSFTNPGVFKTIQEANAGDEFEVDVTKNDQGYNQWVKVTPLDGKEPAPAASKDVVPGKVLGSQYETRDERLTRQLHIVRQSSISNAIATLSPGSKGALDAASVLKVAQEYVDFVYGNSEEDLAAGSADNS